MAATIIQIRCRNFVIQGTPGSAVVELPDAHLPFANHWNHQISGTAQWQAIRIGCWNDYDFAGAGMCPKSLTSAKLSRATAVKASREKCCSQPQIQSDPEGGLSLIHISEPTRRTP